MKHAKLWNALLAVMLATASVQASKLDELLADLGGKDEVARSRARLLLARESIVEAAPRVVAMILDTDPSVSRAAFNVLMDFSADVSVPGRETEHAELARQMITLIAPERAADIKNYGLRLLPFVVPDGFDLGPVAALLAGQDELLSEKARVALQEIGTPEARKVLREHLPKARPEFQCAILNALGALKDAASLKAMEALILSSDSGVRAAAARAVAWTGDPFRLAAVRQVVTQADDATRREAQDALLRLLNAMEAQGGNWEIVVAGYQDLIKSETGALKDGALAGLGRMGDESCVQPVLTAVRDAEVPTRLVGLEALRQMQGVGVVKALVGSYPAQPRDLQLALLEVLGTKKHAAALPILFEGLHSKDATFHTAALEAFRLSELPEASQAFLEVIDSANEQEKALARTGILAAANSMRVSGNNHGAGLSYLAALQHADSDDTRRAALEGLTACPLVEALPEVKKAAGNKSLAGPAARALVATAKALSTAKQKKEAIDALETARSLDSSPELARIILTGLRDAGAAGDYAALLGLVTHWWVVGPFELGTANEGWDKAFISEPDVSLTAKYMSGKRRVEWTPAKPADDRGVIDLHKSISNGDNLVGYVYTEITVDKEMDAILLIGADDSERVWINGQKVYEKFVPRALAPDEDSIPVHLKAGGNTILMKIWQQTQGWEFCARLTAPDGKPIVFTQKSK